jgi:hypothetical protein
MRYARVNRTISFFTTHSFQNVNQNHSVNRRQAPTATTIAPAAITMVTTRPTFAIIIGALFMVA